jgi:hypothetical protein
VYTVLLANHLYILSCTDSQTYSIPKCRKYEPKPEESMHGLLKSLKARALFLSLSIHWSVPEIIDPVFAKTSQNARFLLSENERFGLVFVKTGSINSSTEQDRRSSLGQFEICFYCNFIWSSWISVHTLLFLQIGENRSFISFALLNRRNWFICPGV